MCLILFEGGRWQISNLMKKPGTSLWKAGYLRAPARAHFDSFVKAISHQPLEFGKCMTLQDFVTTKNSSPLMNHAWQFIDTFRGSLLLPFFYAKCSLSLTKQQLNCPSNISHQSGLSLCRAFLWDMMLLVSLEETNVE